MSVAVTERLITVKAPRNADWPTSKLVQLGEPSPTARGTVRDVLLDGLTIGRVESFTHRPFSNVPGARTSREWRIYPGVGRPSYSTRWQALAVVIREYLESEGARP